MGLKENEFIICPNCKGRKYVYDHMACCCTLGLGYLMGRDEICPTCDGKGFIKVTDGKKKNKIEVL